MWARLFTGEKVADLGHSNQQSKARTISSSQHTQRHMDTLTEIDTHTEKHMDTHTKTHTQTDAHVLVNSETLGMSINRRLIWNLM